MNLEEMRAALAAARTELHTRSTALEAANTRVQEAADGEADALVAEVTRCASAFDEQADEVERLRTNLGDAERRERVLADNPAPTRDAAAGRIEVGTEPMVYSEHSADRGVSFFSDAYRLQYSADPEARERLERHGRQTVDLLRSRGQQYRDVGTGAFAGLTIPQYLIDEFAPLARAGAPLLAAVPKRKLPASGMVLSISRITTGSAVAAQASENSGVQETDMDDTKLDVNVCTYTGQQDVSRQALERSEGVDAEVFADLASDYYTKLDDAILNADGTSGTHLGIRSTAAIVAVTYTDASPTVPELYPKAADAIQQIATGRFAPALLTIMHPRRWGWATAALDTQNRPLVVPQAQGPFNALAVGEAPEYGAVVGQMQGLPIISDANMKTNLGGGTEDVIIIVRTPDLRFWQEGDGSPRQFRFEQSNAPQSVRLAVWGYTAFTAGKYPKASATISGTGLAAPTF